MKKIWLFVLLTLTLILSACGTPEWKIERDLGKEAAESGDLNKAVEHYEKAVELNSNQNIKDDLAIVTKERDKKEVELEKERKKKEQEEKEQAEKEAAESEELKKIIASADFQNVTDGKQKVVLTVENSSENIFDGEVKFRATDTDGLYISGDTVYIEELLPGLQTKAITWIKLGASDSDFNVSGSFTEADIIENDKYEIVRSEPGNASQTLFVITEDDEEQLIEITKELRERYDSDSMVRLAVFYYSEENKSDALEGQLDSSFADYSANYTNDYSELYISSTSEWVEVK